MLSQFYKMCLNVFNTETHMNQEGTSQNLTLYIIEDSLLYKILLTNFSFVYLTVHYLSQKLIPILHYFIRTY